MSVKRKQISKSLRFSVFSRDGFTCQYCGKQPPNVCLHVDHIKPVSKGGSNEIDNLITACVDCNLGKGSKEIRVNVNESDSLKRAQEVMEFIHLSEEFSKAHSARQSMRDDICSYLCDILNTDSVNKSSVTGIMKAMESFGVNDVFSWIEKSALKTVTSKRHEQEAMKYFYGILRIKREELEGLE